MHHIIIMTSILFSGDICELCCSDFNKTTNSRVECPSCEYPVCRSCTRIYLLGTMDNPHCLNCKNRWQLDTLIKNTLKSFVNGDYKEHRKKMLFDHEKSRMPETMNAVENYKKVKVLTVEYKAENAKLKELEAKIRELEDARYNLKWKVSGIKGRLNDYKCGVEKSIKKEFKQKCPKDGCLGFLSTQWKCGLCETKVCSKCLAIKENEIPHECNEDDVKSAELIKKETRSCPSCGTNIFKIMGCFEKDTKILMWNTEVKNIQDIKIGDVLVGSDGTKRIVKETFSGKDNLYTVKQNNGETYVVNSKHELLLKPTYYKKIKITNKNIIHYWFDREKYLFKSKKIPYNSENFNTILKNVKEFSSSILEKPFKITIDNYLKLNKSTKNRIYGFKGNNIQWKKQKVEFDPYILGSWLGDGYSDGSGISSNDVPIVKKWMEWCKNNDAELVHTAAYRFSVRRKGAGYKRGAIGSETDCKGCEKEKFSLCTTSINYSSSKRKAKSTSPLKDILRKYNLIKNKHIPKQYLMNSREIRYQLLAGIIDTDGCLTNQNKRITIVQVNEKLSNQICLLARSLGYNVTIRKIPKKNVKLPNCSERKDCCDQFRINISGNISEIPTILKRKKCINSQPNKDYSRTGIKILFNRNDKYYGFMVDKDNTFILPDFTSVKNCDQMWCVQCHTAFSWKTGMKLTGVIHNPHFFQWQANGGEAAPVNLPGVQMCGGLPFWTTYRYNVKNQLSKIFRLENPELYNNYLTFCRELYRASHHFNDVELDNIRHKVNNAQDNKVLRIKYMAGELEEGNFKTQIMSKDKKQNKLRAILEVYELVNVILSETLRDIHETSIEFHNNYLQHANNSENWVQTIKNDVINYFNNKINRIEKVRRYANYELLKISVLYSQTVGIINTEYYTTNRKFKKTDIETYKDAHDLISI